MGHLHTIRAKAPDRLLSRFFGTIENSINSSIDDSLSFHTKRSNNSIESPFSSEEDKINGNMIYIYIYIYIEKEDNEEVINLLVEEGNPEIVVEIREDLENPSQEENTGSVIDGGPTPSMENIFGEINTNLYTDIISNNEAPLLSHHRMPTQSDKLVGEGDIVDVDIDSIIGQSETNIENLHIKQERNTHRRDTPEEKETPRIFHTSQSRKMSNSNSNTSRSKNLQEEEKEVNIIPKVYLSSQIINPPPVIFDDTPNSCSNPNPGFNNKMKMNTSCPLFTAKTEENIFQRICDYNNYNKDERVDVIEREVFQTQETIEKIHKNLLLNTKGNSQSFDELLNILKYLIEKIMKVEKRFDTEAKPSDLEGLKW